MDSLHFNGFYKPFLQALKIKNIYKNQLKHNNVWFNIVYFLSLMMLIFSIVFLANSSSKNVLLLSFMYISACFLFFSIDRRSLKKSVKLFRKKHNMKFIFPDLFDQFKYYLWKERLGAIHSSHSIEKALNYLEIELSKFNHEKDNASPSYIIILSAITIAAFWKIIDDAHFNPHTKIIIDGLICYLSYRFITFKFFIFEGKQKKLLVFKQFLLRLKAEDSSIK